MTKDNDFFPFWLQIVPFFYKTIWFHSSIIICWQRGELTLGGGGAGERGWVLKCVSVQLLIQLPRCCGCSRGLWALSRSHRFSRSRRRCDRSFVFHCTNLAFLPAHDTSQNQRQTKDDESNQKKNLEMNCSKEIMSVISNVF